MESVLRDVLQAVLQARILDAYVTRMAQRIVGRICDVNIYTRSTRAQYANLVQM